MAVMTFEEHLAAWLPGQRWFAGKGTPITDLAVVAQTTLVAGDPGLRHLIVAVTQDTGTDSYQLFMGLRADLPGRLEHVRIGTVDGGLIGYDGLHDPDLTAALLAAMAAEESIGPLRFGQRPGGHIETGLESLVLTAEQSNTSLLFGEEAILKVFRRLSPGPNPDLEVPDALARLAATVFRVMPHSNRVGIRLRAEGRAPSLRSAGTATGELDSEGVVTGAVQVPPDGDPVVLMPDHATLGGYPVLAVVASADHGRLGQCAPGTVVRLVPIDLASASVAARASRRTLERAVVGHYPLAVD